MGDAQTDDLQKFGQFEYFTTPNSYIIEYLKNSPKLWAKFPNSVFSLSTRFAAIDLDVYNQVIKEKISITDFDDILIDSTNYSNYLELIENELETERIYRRSQVMSQMRTTKLSLEDLVKNTNIKVKETVIAAGRVARYDPSKLEKPKIVAKVKSSRGRKVVSILEKLRNIKDTGKILNVSKITDTGTGIVAISPPTGKGTVRMNNRIDIASNNYQSYILTLDILRSEYESLDAIFEEYDQLVEWANNAW